MRPQTRTQSAAGASSIIAVDWRQPEFKVGMAVVVTGTNTSTVEHTFDDIFDPAITPVWFPTTGMTGMTVNTEGNLAFPPRGVRLNVTAFTSGSATLTYIQAGGQ